jgi:hypothetical protein
VSDLVPGEKPWYVNTGPDHPDLFPPLATHFETPQLIGYDGWRRLSSVRAAPEDLMYGLGVVSAGTPIMALDFRGYFGRTRRTYQVIIVSPHGEETPGKYVIRYRDECCSWSAPSLPTDIDSTNWRHVLNGPRSRGPSALSGVYIAWPAGIPFAVGEMYEFTVGNTSHVPLRGFNSKLRTVTVQAYDVNSDPVPVEILLTANGRPVMERIVSPDHPQIDCPMEISSLELTGIVPMPGTPDAGRVNSALGRSSYEVYYEAPNVRPQFKYTLSQSLGGYCLYVRAIPDKPSVLKVYCRMQGCDVLDKSNLRSTDILLSI